MRVLMVVHRMPFPPRTGEKVRAYHFARHLERHHRLTLAFLADEPGFEPALADLRREFTDVEHARIPRRPRRLTALASLAAGRSATMTYFDSAALRERLAKRLRAERFDVVFLYSSSMIQYVPDSMPDLPVVMDFVDVDSEKWREYADRLPRTKRWVYRLEAERLRRYELVAARRASRSLVVTRPEADILHRIAGWAPVTVVPNGVDLDYFVPAERPADAPVIAFTGAMDYLPNVDAVTHFADAIFPAIRARVPAARFVIVGRSPAPAVTRLAARPGIEVTGTVPDVRDYLRAAAVAVAPLRIARGLQNKVLEAMAMRLPVVATWAAHEGIDARSGRDLLVENDPARFATSVGDLLGSAARRAALGAAARRYVETHHSWTAATARLDEALHEVTRHATAGRPAVAAGAKGS